MQVCYKAGSVEFRIDATTVKEAFERLSNVQEVFTGEACGCCESPFTAPVCRTRDGFTFYEMKCKSCSATLSYGQTKEGNLLFAKRYDKDKGRLPDNGWKVWKREEPVGATSSGKGSSRKASEDPFS